MGERSLFSQFLLLVIAISAVLGIYFVVENFNLYRAEQGKIALELRDMREELIQLRKEQRNLEKTLEEALEQHSAALDRMSEALENPKNAPIKNSGAANK